jgi:hypothetical protein
MIAPSWDVCRMGLYRTEPPRIGERYGTLNGSIVRIMEQDATTKLYKVWVVKGGHTISGFPGNAAKTTYYVDVKGNYALEGDSCTSMGLRHLLSEMTLYGADNRCPYCDSEMATETSVYTRTKPECPLEVAGSKRWYTCGTIVRDTDRMVEIRTATCIYYQRLQSALRYSFSVSLLLFFVWSIIFAGLAYWARSEFNVTVGYIVLCGGTLRTVYLFGRRMMNLWLYSELRRR